MLTQKQSELLAFLRTYVGEHGRTPNYSQMADAMGLASKSSVARLIEGMEARGYVRRLGSRHWGVEIIERPENLTRAEAMVRVARRCLRDTAMLPEARIEAALEALERVA